MFESRCVVDDSPPAVQSYDAEHRVRGGPGTVLLEDRRSQTYCSGHHIYNKFSPPNKSAGRKRRQLRHGKRLLRE